MRAENGTTICNINIHFMQTENLLYVKEIIVCIIITFTRTATRRKKGGEKCPSSNFIMYQQQAVQRSHFTQHFNSIRLCVFAQYKEREKNDVLSISKYFLFN